MSLVPRNAMGPDADPPHPTLQSRPLDVEEQRLRWRVRAAQWRARELAEAIWGGVGRTELFSVRAGGPFRGLLRLDVPFSDLDDHRVREGAFLEAARHDPLLSVIPLLYIVGPDGV